MNKTLRRFVIVASLLSPTSAALAQTPADPSGHWSGSIEIQGMQMSFEADLARNMTGDLAGTISVPSVEGTPLPFTLARTGDAQIDPPLMSAPITKALEGTWTTQTASGKRLDVRLSNLPDGTATGLLVNVDQGGLEIPVAIVQKAATVRLEAKVVPGTFAGALNVDGTQLTGEWTEPSGSVTLTLVRKGK